MAAVARQESRGAEVDDYLFLYGAGMDDTGRAVMRQAADVSWRWKKVIWVDDDFAKLQGGFSREVFVAVMHSLRSHVDDGIHIDQVYLSKLWDRCEKTIVEAFSEAALGLVEDGLHSYAPMKMWSIVDRDIVAGPLDVAYRCKEWLLHRRTNVDRIRERRCCREHIERIDRVYMILHETLPLPEYLNGKPVRSIERAHLLAVIDQARHLFSKNERSIEEPRALMLGQGFAAYDEVSWDEELAIYIRAATFLAERGYVPLWKEHPRARPPFGDAIRKRVPQLQRLERTEDDAWPIEVLLDRLGIDACVSITSTGLYYLNHLFDLPTFSLAKDIAPKLRGEHRFTAEMTAERIPYLHDADLRAGAAVSCASTKN